MIARGDYAAAAELSGGVRLGASDLGTAVGEYPATLTVPPRGAEPPLDVIEITHAEPRAWSIDVPIWSAKEGRSDLTLQLTPHA